MVKKNNARGEKVKVEKSKEAIVKTLEFTFSTALIAVPLYLIFNSTTFLNDLAARGTQIALQMLGKSSTLAMANGFPLLKLGGFSGAGGLDVEIINLCAGGIELALLAGFVLASRDKPLSYRVKGIAAGFAFFFIFNSARIAFTINSFGTAWFEPLHEVLFRAILIIGLVTFYAVWYLWRE